MFTSLGKFVARFWPWCLGLWVLLLAVGYLFGPTWESVSRTGEVSFLPEDRASRRGDRLFQKAFPLDYSASTVAIVLSRTDESLRASDFEFIQKSIVPALGSLEPTNGEESPIIAIHTHAERGVGELFVSPDRKATLVGIELNTSFQDRRNGLFVDKVENLVERFEREAPQGLQFGITGSAAAGRDLARAEEQSVDAIETWTIIIVVALLLLLYRAPLVALIPLVTVFFAVSIALPMLGMLAHLGWIAPARDLRVFITVLAYGAGVDYCLFLIARYREELHEGVTPGQAMARAVERVGGAITASAATVIFGIGMLAFAQFGKIQQAGVVIPLALSVALLATLTLAAPLLRWAGRAAFWPQRVKPAHDPEPHHAHIHPELHSRWGKLGAILLRRPGTVLALAVFLMTPFALLAVTHRHDINYNPLGDLPDSAPSAQGNKMLAAHFPPGLIGPVTAVIHAPDVDFTSNDGAALIERLHDRLLARREELQIADLRSVVHPLGVSALAHPALAKIDPKDIAVQTLAKAHYVSRAGDFAKHATRLDVTFASDPLGRDAIAALSNLEKALREDLPSELARAEIGFSGSTASLRDLSEIKRDDERLIQVLVCAVVLLLLVLVVRRVILSVYLVATVLFSYLATMGLTYLVFRMLAGPDFAGIDWKVPIFLFTILVAVGEDYNIFLLSRVQEEERRHGPLHAIPVALARTGNVISSCGLIMAGTFASLLSGSLEAMKQLGFALSVGVLIDTLVVRPVLVPAFLVLMQRHFPEKWGKQAVPGSPRNIEKEVIAR